MRRKLSPIAHRWAHGPLVVGYPADVSGVTVGEVLDALVATGVSLWTRPSGRESVLSWVVVHDGLAPLKQGDRSILLAPGLTASEVLESVLTEAARHGWPALAVKAHGVDPAALAAAADELDVAVLGVPDDVDWLTLGLAMTSAVTRTVGPVPGSSTFGDLFALANSIAASVGGAVTIEDFQQRILAHSTIAGHLIDAGRREGILGRRVPASEANVEQYRAVYRSETPLRFPATPPALPRVAIAIRSGTEVLGSIWVVDTGSLAPDVDHALSAAGDVAALHLLRDRHAGEAATKGRHDAVSRLLEGDPDPMVTADALGLDPAGPFTVLLVAPRVTTPGVAPLFRVVNLVALHAESQLGRSCTALIGDAAHVIVSGRRAGDKAAIERLACHVVDIVRTSLRIDVVIALGPAVDDLTATPIATDEARRILALLRRRPALGPVAGIDQVADQLALTTLEHLTATNPRALSTRAAAIRRHDQSAGTDIQALLRTWFETGRDVRATAERLSMHPNTVRYRLRRTATVFNLDYLDGDQMLLLWLSLRVTNSPNQPPTDPSSTSLSSPPDPLAQP